MCAGLECVHMVVELRTASGVYGAMDMCRASGVHVSQWMWTHTEYGAADGCTFGVCVWRAVDLCPALGTYEQAGMWAQESGACTALSCAHAWLGAFARGLQWMHP